MSEKSTKEKIMEEAARLFYYNGFDGTSIRSITDHANVNVSMIKYYFNNKQGLLEHMTVDYFEKYIDMLEEITNEEELTDQEHFFHVIDEIIHYKYERFQFSCFIQRELSLDNMFIRELFSTYVAKEKYLLKKITNSFSREWNLNGTEREVFYLQLKSLINGPFTYANDWQDQYHWDRSEDTFISQYVQLLKKWFS
ncbi:forespore capture DNA-binding protein RefZ [Aquisalibacillus elongatus]|uniref:TetR family transcriptional regulator n=1 Tax=Aquisalibacillus elongatus TaxID=485577 RepID=A0A3N5CDW7_9BACI|nr:forespore capture DNA-binding protein RefZ [Aquisalibacillus elongatus]RPF55341.1 TetR family transcriptional regulator [Aquisalibacillus elongatus]